MIDFGEFLLLVTKYERPLSEEREIREMFKALDRDRNGFIDPSDLKTSFAGLGIQLTNADVQAMMDEVQPTDDHKICFNGWNLILYHVHLAYRGPVKRSHVRHTSPLPAQLLSGWPYRTGSFYT